MLTLIIISKIRTVIKTFQSFAIRGPTFKKIYKKLRFCFKRKYKLDYLSLINNL